MSILTSYLMTTTQTLILQVGWYGWWCKPPNQKLWKFIEVMRHLPLQTMIDEINEVLGWGQCLLKMPRCCFTILRILSSHPTRGYNFQYIISCGNTLSHSSSIKCSFFDYNAWNMIFIPRLSLLYGYICKFTYSTPRVL